MKSFALVFAVTFAVTFGVNAISSILKGMRRAFQASEIH